MEFYTVIRHDERVVAPDPVAHELAELRRHWAFAYRVTWEHGMFRAVSHLDRSAVSMPTAARLEREMQQDYRLRRA